ncbi:hypothetical protein HBB16_17385 [Pseudonocardia sp. MCCB 268]|nr:hypothetical protein [Pseudonocardia cytotoxica]
MGMLRTLDRRGTVPDTVLVRNAHPGGHDLRRSWPELAPGTVASEVVTAQRRHQRLDPASVDSRCPTGPGARSAGQRDCSTRPDRGPGTGVVAERFTTFGELPGHQRDRRPRRVRSRRWPPAEPAGGRRGRRQIMPVAAG